MVMVDEGSLVSTARNNGPKAFAGVIALVAIVLGVYAMVEPMSQRIENAEKALADYKLDVRERLAERTERWERELQRIRERMLQDDEREKDDSARFARIDAQFVEVETQLRGIRTIANLRVSAEERTDRMLWKKLFGEELPSTGYWPPVDTPSESGE
ncbi:hypothetical protein AMJ71_06090 [candidate division TA06 bacterium SM1_40]|uniref:Uncharacterized protein n=1 Tax=candidate division TA06 bacterium SM1_40 TaxID=1703773 RepID=A0A0S8JIG7_UNCT6|nr:MAG: hypothetical protein AMJ71_06090 [candidate division TA06 bacterium SM1_40]